MTDTAMIEPGTMSTPMSKSAPVHTAVWFELPAEDLQRAVKFYNHVLKADLLIDTRGPNPMADFPRRDDASVSGHLYPGKPANGAGPTVHFAVPDTLEATLERCTEAGGEVMPGIIPLPVGRFAYATDTEGNSIGFFQFNQ